MSEKLDIKGKDFNNWTVVDYALSNKNGKSMWLCKCNLCKKLKIVGGTELVKGKSRSCKSCASKQFRKKRPYEHLYNKLVASIKRSGHTNSISYDDFLIFTKQLQCHYCRWEVPWPTHQIANMPRHGYNLDRKDNGKGYSVDNCVVCCGLCNFTKADRFTYDEMKILGKTIATIKQGRIKIN